MLQKHKLGVQHLVEVCSRRRGVHAVDDGDDGPLSFVGQDLGVGGELLLQILPGQRVAPVTVGCVAPAHEHLAVLHRHLVDTGGRE